MDGGLRAWFVFRTGEGRLETDAREIRSYLKAWVAELSQVR